MGNEREKVMDGLKWCTTKEGCGGCPYLPTIGKNNRTCKQNLMVDALDVFQKGETRTALPVAHYASPYTGLPIDHCPKCGKLIKRHQKIYTDEIRFCAYCGQEVIWNE